MLHILSENQAQLVTDRLKRSEKKRKLSLDRARLGFPKWKNGVISGADAATRGEEITSTIIVNPERALIYI